MLRRIIGQENRRHLLRQGQLSMQAPVPVRIKEYFPEENEATIQIIGTVVSEFGGASIKGGDQDLRFPIRGACHENLMKGIKPGSEALLYKAGWQTKKGYLELAHAKGLPETPGYTPIRMSWAVGT